MRKTGCGRLICAASLLWYAFYPLWGGTAQFGDKDVLFCAVCLAFVLKTYLYVFEYEEIKGNSFAWYLFLGILTGLLRNNGLYMIVVSIPFVILAVKKQRVKLLLGNIFIIAVISWLTSVVWPAFDVSAGSKAEALSLLFQQTARTVQEHGDELSEDEIEIIDKVLDAETIGGNYVGVISDPVKNTYKLNESENEGEFLKEYIKLWAKMALKYPITYIEAFLDLSYGYYSFISPIESNYAAPSERFYTNISGRSEICDYFKFSYSSEKETRNAFIDYSINVQNSILGIFYQLAFYTWAYVICIVYMISHKSFSKVGGIILIVISIAVCCISPANDLFRYYIAAAAFFPMIFTFGNAINKINGKSA